VRRGSARTPVNRRPRPSPCAKAQRRKAGAGSSAGAGRDHAPSVRANYPAGGRGCGAEPVGTGRARPGLDHDAEQRREIAPGVDPRAVAAAIPRSARRGRAGRARGMRARPLRRRGRARAPMRTARSHGCLTARAGSAWPPPSRGIKLRPGKSCRPRRRHRRRPLVASCGP
jgi:hypothetical protein